MAEEQVPPPSANLPRPSRLLDYGHNPQVPETPPLLPSIHDFEIEAYDTLKMYIVEPDIETFNTFEKHSAAPTMNGHTMRVPQDMRRFADTAGMDKEISAYATIKMPVVKPPDTKPAGNNAVNQPIYANTAYARRLERHQRAREKKLSWKDLRQFGQFVVPFKGYIVLAFILTVGVGLTAIPLPFIFRTMLDQVFKSRDIPLFIWSLVFLLAVFLLEEILSFFNRNIQGSLSRATNLNITHKFYKHMLRLPLSFFQGTASTGQALSRLSEVTSAQQTVIQVLLDTAVNIVLVIIYTVVLFLTDWRLTLVVIAVSPFYIGVSLYFNRRVRQLSRQVLESYAVMNGAMYEGLTALKTVKALAAEHRFGRNIKKLIMYTNTLSFKRTIFQSEANLMIGIVQSLAVIVILSFGGYLVLTNGLTAGELAAYVLILRQLSTPVTTLNGVNQQVQAAAVAIDRLFEVLNYPEEADAEKGIQISNIQGYITFEHVYFSYVPDIEVLHDINLEVQAGSTIALVGRSGAGKTTIANLLMRFYMPNSGRLTIDGYDLRELKIESLRSQFGVILQDDSLFSGTIEDNLKFGLLRKVSQEEMEEAARNANILDFIQSQPLGFKTPLHERGQSLSVGQRQRIAIARMFLHQPKILIMDEPSSALDNESEALIQQAVKRLTAGRTTFIIAHRLSTIRNADRIVTIDDGRVVEQGTHDELLAQKGVYWHLYNSYGRM